jgi:hypothetical protein
MLSNGANRISFADAFDFGNNRSDSASQYRCTPAHWTFERPALHGKQV